MPRIDTSAGKTNVISLEEYDRRWGLIMAAFDSGYDAKRHSRFTS